MESSCVPAFPISSGHTLVRGVLHPLPIDVGEVRKLCEIEQTRVGSHFECVRETRGEPVFGRRSTDTQPATRTALGMTSPTGVNSEEPPSLFDLGLERPLWEILKPSVVVRRRPERMQFLGLT